MENVKVFVYKNDSKILEYTIYSPKIVSCFYDRHVQKIYCLRILKSNKGVIYFKKYVITNYQY